MTDNRGTPQAVDVIHRHAISCCSNDAEVRFLSARLDALTQRG